MNAGEEICLEIMLKIKTCVLFSVRWKYLHFLQYAHVNICSCKLDYGSKKVRIYMVCYVDIGLG